MSVYTLAHTVVQQAIEQARSQGHSEQMLARALMSEIIQVYKRERSNADIANELAFLADNLDDDIDYAFMRP